MSLRHTLSGNTVISVVDGEGPASGELPAMPEFPNLFSGFAPRRAGDNGEPKNGNGENVDDGRGGQHPEVSGIERTVAPLQPWLDTPDARAPSSLEAQLAGNAVAAMMQTFAEVVPADQREPFKERAGAAGMNAEFVHLVCSIEYAHHYLNEKITVAKDAACASADIEGARDARRLLRQVGCFLERIAQGVKLPTGQNLALGESYELLFRAIETSVAEFSTLCDPLRVVCSATPPIPETQEDLREARRRRWAGDEPDAGTIADRLKELAQENSGGAQESEDQRALAEEQATPETATALGDGESFADMVSAGPGGYQERRAGKAVARGLDYYSYLAVRTPQVVTGADGRVRDVYRWAADAGTGAGEIAGLFRKTEVPPLRGSEPDDGQAVVHYPVTGSGIVRLPLSPFHTVVEFTAFNSQGEPISDQGGVRIRECVAGSFEVEIKGEDLAEVRYRVAEKSGVWLGEIDRQLDAAMPVVQTYSPPAYQSVTSVLRKADEPLLKKAKILYDFIVERRFYGARDREIAELINRSGAARNEVIAGLGAANCYPFAYHVALELRKIGVPAFVIAGPIPLEASKDFLVDPGHAQVLVTLPEGLAVFDLTTKVKRDRRVDCSAAPASDWQRGHEAIATGTRRDVYQAVRHIREQILKAGSDSAVGMLSDEWGETSSRGYYAEGSGRISSIGGGGWGSSRQQANPKLVDGLSNNPELRAIQKGLQVRAYFEQFTELVAQARATGDLTTVLAYIRQEEEPPVLTREDLRYLGSEYSNLVFLKPTEVLKQTAKRFLIDNGIGRGLKTQAADLLASDAVAPRIMDIRSPVMQLGNTQDLRADQYNLNRLIDEAPDDAFLQALSNEMLVKVARSSAQELALAGLSKQFPVRAPVDRIHGRPQRIGYPNAVERTITSLQRLAGELTGRSGPGLDQDLSDIAAVTAACAVDLKNRGFWDKDCAEDLLTERANIAVANLTTIAVSLMKAGQTPPDERIFNVLHSADDPWRRGMAAFCTEILDQARFFGGSRPGTQVMSDHLAAAILESETVGDLERSLRRLKEAGFPVDLSRHQARIEPHILGLVAHHFELNGEAEINLPNFGFPASEIVAEASTRRDAGLYRSIRAVQQVGGLASLDSVQSLWPAVDEGEVAQLLAHTIANHGDSSDSRALFINNAPFDGKSISFDDIPALLEVGLRGRPISLVILTAMEKMGLFPDPLAGSFNRFREQFPAQWGILSEKVLPEVVEGDTNQARSSKLYRRDNCSQALMTALFAGIPQQELYPALIGMAAARVLAYPDGVEHFRELEWNRRQEVINDADAPLVDLCLRMASMPAEWLHSPELMGRFMQENAPARLAESRFFRDARVEVQRSTIFATLLSKELAEDHRGDKLGYAAGFHYGEFRDFAEVILNSGRAPEGEIWNDAFGKSTSTAFHLYGILPRLRLEAERMHRTAGQRSSRPFARYLAQESGRVNVRASSGEFSSYRPYVPGDDLRMLDQKLIARTDRQFIKQFVEREEPPIVFLVDAEFLIEGYAERTNAEAYGSKVLQKNLADFYRTMFMSEISGVTPHLRINVRGFNQESYDQEGVRKILHPAELRGEDDEDRYCPAECRTTDELFLYERLCACLTAERIVRLESRLYGTEGFHSFGILDGNDTDLPKGADVLAFIHPRNIPASLPQLARLNGGREVRIFGMKHGAVNRRGGQ